MRLRMQVMLSCTILHMHVTKNGENKSGLIIRLSLEDTGVSQQKAFSSGQSLHRFSQHIFKMLQDLALAEIQW